jgi:hypothetical protein
MQLAEYVTEKRPGFVLTSSYAKAAEDKTPWQANRIVLAFNYPAQTEASFAAPRAASSGRSLKEMGKPL